MTGECCVGVFRCRRATWCSWRELGRRPIVDGEDEGLVLFIHATSDEMENWAGDGGARLEEIFWYCMCRGDDGNIYGSIGGVY